MEFENTAREIDLDTLKQEMGNEIDEEKRLDFEIASQYDEGLKPKGKLL